MKIALCGPTDLHGLARDQGIDTIGVPAGIGPTPLAPLIGELLAREHQVTLYTLSHDIEEERYFEWGALRIFVGPSAMFGAARRLYSRERQYLRRTIANDKPAFVHSHWTYEFTLGALDAHVPVLVTIHDLPWNVLRYFRDRCRTVRLMLAYVVAARAKHFTAVSEDAARHFSRYMRPGSNIPVVPNFVPKLLLSKSKGPQSHPMRPLVYATVIQGWTRNKNPTVALQAFAQLRRSAKNARLVMIGRGYHEGGPAETWARKHNCKEGVLFLGELEYADMVNYIRDNIDVLLVPSLNESFSMVALEGMTLGKPVIAGEGTSGVREVLGRGTAGVLTNVQDPAAVANAMLRLDRDPILFEGISRLGYSRATSAYSAETVIDAYESLYREIMK